MTFFLRLLFVQIGFTAVTTMTYSCFSNATCGCSFNSPVISRIVGGEQAGADTWGWAASIRIGNRHICGGVLISSTLILTAAHCLTSCKSIRSLSINIGSKYLSVIGQRRTVSNVYVNQNYDSINFAHDIAIIGLSSPINMNDHSIALICLPSTINTDYPPVDATVVAIGWGVLSSGDRNPSNTLQQVTLKTVSKYALTCQKVIRNVNVQFCSGVQGGGKGIEQ